MSMEAQTVGNGNSEGMARDSHPRELPVHHHLILPPADDAPADADSECLLAISPGAMLGPESFRALASAVQAAAPHLRLWVGVLNMDFVAIINFFCGPLKGPPTDAHLVPVTNGMREIDGYNQLLQQLVDQAVAAGFRPRGEAAAAAGSARSGSGSGSELRNVALLCQSAGSLGYADVGARRAAACVFLASVPNPAEHVKHKRLCIETWPTPLLVLGGELDGQMRWPLYAPYLAEAAGMATKFGAGYASATKPVIIAPGVNHGNTSNGEARVWRGDVAPGLTAELDACMQVLGSHIAAFLTARFAASGDARSEAGAALLAAVRETVALTAPYGRALGMGDWSAPFLTAAAAAGGEGGEAAGPEVAAEVTAAAAEGPCRPGSIVLGSGRDAGAGEHSALHPGMVAAAEAHAADAQRLLLAQLPPAEAARLTVVGTAHTEAGSFERSEATMAPLPHGRWLLHVHVMMHFRALDSDRSYICPYAPEYWLKLKSAELVAALLGLPEPSSVATPPPSALNRLAMERALAAAPPAVAERYLTRGRQLVFEDEGDLAPSEHSEDPSPPPPRLFPPKAATGNNLFHYPPAAAPAGGGGGAPPGAPPFAAGPPPPPPEPASLAPVRVVSPLAVMPLPADVAAAASSPTPGRRARAAGSYYTRVMSVAQAMEWVWVDCLRSIDTPW